MKKNSTIAWEEHAALEDCPKNIQTLMQAARDALTLAHAPYSKFQVGAAVRNSQGEVFKGANFENAAYPMCLCAERSVLAAAISSGSASPISEMAITVNNLHQHIGSPAAPCGACRQVMLEVEQRQGQPFSVYIQGASGPVLAFDSASVLLPFGFTPDFLGTGK